MFNFYTAYRMAMLTDRSHTHTYTNVCMHVHTTTCTCTCIKELDPTTPKTCVILIDIHTCTRKNVINTQSKTGLYTCRFIVQFSHQSTCIYSALIENEGEEIICVHVHVHVHVHLIHLYTYTYMYMYMYCTYNVNYSVHRELDPTMYYTQDCQDYMYMTCSVHKTLHYSCIITINPDQHSNDFICYS